RWPAARRAAGCRADAADDAAADPDAAKTGGHQSHDRWAAAGGLLLGLAAAGGRWAAALSSASGTLGRGALRAGDRRRRGSAAGCTAGALSRWTCPSRPGAARGTLAAAGARPHVRLDGRTRVAVTRHC